MNKYVEHLLQLYKEKRIEHEVALSLLESYKMFGNKPESDDPIAIVGLACQMPMADSKDEFWQQLKSGTNCISDFPWQRRQDTDPLIPVLAHNLHSTENPYWQGGFLSSVDSFDNDFFHILPSEAKIMDPQQRLFLKVAHTAFEDAGYSIEKLQGSNTGVFVGDVVNEYRKIVTEVSPLAVIGNISPFIASRVAYFYDLHGPTINVSTTCSTSLVAVHLACQSLLTRESELVLVGAVNLRLFPFAFKDDPVDALGITTSDGACYAFDDRASGIVRGEGAGALVLKRYQDAVRDKNHIYALIRGSHVNNDGRSSNAGAPNPLAHAALLKKAWARSCIDPRQISYIEAHGTGTRIGDPIEVQGIAKAFSSFTKDRQFCGIGSVKTNIGHLTGGASGLAGLIKTVLGLHHEQIPPSLCFNHPNSLIDFPNTPVFVVNRLTAWPREEKPRIAGVSAFGFNGTNCHVVLEEAPALIKKEITLTRELPFLFTHRTQSGLQKQIQQYLPFLEKNKKHLRLEDISYTLFAGRDHYPVQLILLARSVEDLSKQIADFLLGAIVSIPRSVDWVSTFRGLEPHLIPLPTYFFEDKRFWLETPCWNNDDHITSVAAGSLKQEKEQSLIEQLVCLFQEVMGLEKIQPTDSFLDLGGDSLLGVEIISLIHKRLGKKISYHDLFQNPRIIDLAKVLEVKEVAIFHDIFPAPLQEIYPLSHGQRRLWILHQMQDHPIAYNIYDAYQFDNPIDLDNFQKALDQLVERHVAFRTIFIENNGEPYQKITSQCHFDLTVMEVSSMEMAYEKMHSFKQRPFDLENGPLAKAMLLRLPQGTSLFFFMMHHIISDGWSIRIIIEELLKLYRGVSLDPLRISTIDYCHWQHHQAVSEKRFQQLERFWIERLQAPIPTCEIPGDKERPPVFTFQGARQSFRLSKEYEQKLSIYGAKESATLFMILLASVYVLIYRYTKQTDLIVGSPIAGRFHADLKPLVGFFVNTLALRCTLNPSENFSQLLRRVKEQVLHDFEHQDYPFDLLIDQLKLERDTSRSPLFNINFAFQNFELDEEAKKTLAQLKTSRIDLPHESCKWDLEFEFVKQQDGSFFCFVEYYKDLYSEEMISILISTYQSLLHSVVEECDKPIDAWDLSPSSECISGASVSYPHMTLHKLFEEQAANYPKHPAIKFSNQVVSYEGLNEQANRLAHFLKFEKQLQPEQCVGLYLENSPEAVISILGILKAGGAYVPLDIKSPLERTRFIIEKAKIRSLISMKKHLRVLNDLQWSTSLESFVCLDSDSIEDELEEIGSNFMDSNLWDQVAREGQDEITSSGWISSYTGEPFSLQEMEEYQQNVLKKLCPYLHSNCRVLEIGCGSGLTAFAIASHVGFYLGLDLSQEIIKKNQSKAQREDLPHLSFACYQAHEIAALNEKAFDIVIINSVIHCFPGHNYLRNILKKAIDLLKKQSILFLGDLMDLSLKNQLRDSLYRFREAHRNKGVHTKLDWDQELFISKEFLLDLKGVFPCIAGIEWSRKEGSIENELTQFRFDVVLFINKEETSNSLKRKEQYDRRCFDILSSQNLELDLSDRTMAYILFTSGSSGLPKGVMVEHRSIHNYIQWAISYYSVDSLKFPLYSPLHFDLTVTSIFAPLLSGGYLRILSGEIDEVLESLGKTTDCNILKLTPAHLTMILERGLVFSSIQQLIVGGDTLYSAQAAHTSRLYNHSIGIYNEYGPTEATVGCIAHRWSPTEKEGAVLIGDPIANCTVHILDEYLRPVPIGGIGEIVIEGDCLARGYLNHPELTEQKFRENPRSGVLMYCTGDLGRYLPSKKIAYMGRRDRQIKIKGYRIELDEIESRLLQHPFLKACTVIVKEDPLYGKMLYAYYVADVLLTAEEVSQFLLQTLPSYMVPSFLIQIDTLPLTSNGKIDISKLPDPQLIRTKAVVLPQSGIEISLHKIWSRVLNIPEAELSTEDDFFDLGGDSIMAMRILPQVKKLGLHLSIKEIFQYRTIKALSGKVSPDILPTDVQEEIYEPFIWSPIQQWFWDHKMHHPAYFTMAYLFRIPDTLQVERLEAAFGKCFEHHEALRLIFKEDRQEVAPLSDLRFQIEEFKLGNLKEEDQKAEVLRLTALVQNSFDLGVAPLMKAVVLDLGKEGKRLFLAIHHLIIDGVSWRYLIEDLSTLYSSSLQQDLPAKTDSYRRWVQTLAELPLFGKEEIGEWLDIDPSSFPKLFHCPYPDVQDTVETFIHLSQEETGVLVSNNRFFYEANPNEILLSSLALSIAQSFGIEKLLIHHEGHGRDPIGGEDISRTVGWFTTIYPLLLETGADGVCTLLNVKEKLRKFNEKALFYCVARYLQRNSHLERFCPEILFNYFGRVDEDLLFQDGRQVFGNSQETIGATSHPANHLPHCMEINAIIIEGCLRISVVYSPKSMDYALFQSWLNSFKTQILQYITAKEKILCSSGTKL